MGEQNSQDASKTAQVRMPVSMYEEASKIFDASGYTFSEDCGAGT